MNKEVYDCVTACLQQKLEVHNRATNIITLNLWWASFCQYVQKNNGDRSFPFTEQDPDGFQKLKAPSYY